MLVRFVGILEWVGETLICKTPAVPLILRATQASCLSASLSDTHVFNMSLCHFLSFIKLFMSASSLQAKKSINIWTIRKSYHCSLSRSRTPAFRCPLRSFITTWDSNEFDKSRQTLSCVLSLVAASGATAALDQWAHRRAGTSDCSGRLVDVDWSSCRCAELGENTLNLPLALS